MQLEKTIEGKKYVTDNFSYFMWSINLNDIFT